MRYVLLFVIFTCIIWIIAGRWVLGAFNPATQLLLAQKSGFADFIAGNLSGGSIALLFRK